MSRRCWNVFCSGGSSGCGSCPLRRYSTSGQGIDALPNTLANCLGRISNHAGGADSPREYRCDDCRLAQCLTDAFHRIPASKNVVGHGLANSHATFFYKLCAHSRERRSHCISEELGCNVRVPAKRIEFESRRHLTEHCAQTGAESSCKPGLACSLLWVTRLLERTLVGLCVGTSTFQATAQESDAIDHRTLTGTGHSCGSSAQHSRNLRRCSCAHGSSSRTDHQVGDLSKGIRRQVTATQRI